MGKKKHKHQEHYCKMCGEYKSNESFSGKGTDCTSARNVYRLKKKRNV